MVQTMKWALRKCLLDGVGKDWDEPLLHVVMGYRMSRQKAVGYSPYFLMIVWTPSFILGCNTWRRRSWIVPQELRNCKSF